ncbi:MAG TPA: hypothetical protein PLZ75_01510 [Bacteroidales bacterium]|nr:hypothetical protein [Bacteroidales bacterium]
MNADRWSAFRKHEKEPFAGSKPSAGGDGGNHFANFLEALRAGKPEMLNCEIIEGVYSAALVHLANISYKLGRSLRFINGYEKFANDPEADTLLSRDYRSPYIVPAEV